MKRLVLTGCVLVLALGSARAAADSSQSAYPNQASIGSAHAFLSTRAGRTAFAVVDTNGQVQGVRPYETFASASVVKGMLLVAYLRHLHAQNRGLTGTDKGILYPMIHVSDNNAASAAFARIGGSQGLRNLARAAHMKNFSASGWWGLTRICAADQAHFFLDMNSLLPDEFRDYARKLLSNITPSQSWGIPAAARPRKWRVFFKGGWLPQSLGLVNQAAWLDRPGTHIAIAVLTEGNPSMGYGEATIEGIASHLLKNTP